METTRWAKLTRGPSTPDGIVGQYESDSGLKLLILEKPDLQNAPDTSCVLKDVYTASWFQSPKHGWCYKLNDAHGRTNVEIHAANVHEQLLGCLAPGLVKASFDPDSLHPGVPSRAMVGVGSSAAALKTLEKDMQDAQGAQQPFRLTIC